MFGKRRDGGAHGRIDSLIGAGTVIEGDVGFGGGLRVDGLIRGRVFSVEGKAAMLVLSDNARIEGAVSVGHLIMNGTIVGAVSVSEALEMQSRARIVGDVEYASIEMHQGAVIEGRLVHREVAVVELMQAEMN